MLIIASFSGADVYYRIMCMKTHLPSTSRLFYTETPPVDNTVFWDMPVDLFSNTAGPELLGWRVYVERLSEGYWNSTVYYTLESQVTVGSLQNQREYLVSIYKIAFDGLKMLIEERHIRARETSVTISWNPQTQGAGNGYQVVVQQNKKMEAAFLHPGVTSYSVSDVIYNTTYRVEIWFVTRAHEEIYLRSFIFKTGGFCIEYINDELRSINYYIFGGFSLFFINAF